MISQPYIRIFGRASLGLRWATSVSARALAGLTFIVFIELITGKFRDYQAECYFPLTDYSQR